MWKTVETAPQKGCTMSIPKQVLDAAKKAEKAHKEAYEKNTDEPALDTPKTSPEETPVVEAEPPISEVPVVTQEGLPDAPPVAPVETEPEPQPTEPEAEPEPPKEDWEQKYKVLQGKYNAELNEMRNTLADMRMAYTEMFENNRRMREEMESLRSPTPEPPEPTYQDYFSVKEIQGYLDAGYDETQLNMMAKLAHRIAQKEASQYGDTISNVQQTMTQTREQRFWSTLDEKVPDWRTWNEDRGFMASLDAPISPYINMTKRQAFNEAYQNRDGSTIAQFFSDYKEQINAATAQPQHSAPATPKAQPHVQPPRGPNAPPPKTPKVYSAGEIQQIYRDAARGKYGSGEQWENMKTELDRALVEGRIKQ